MSRIRSGKSRRTLLGPVEPARGSEIRLTPKHVNLVLASVFEERALTGDKPPLVAVAERLKLDPRGRQIKRVFRNSLSLVDRIWSRVDRTGRAAAACWPWLGKTIRRRYGKKEYDPVPCITGPRGNTTVDPVRRIYIQCARNGKPLPPRARIVRCTKTPGCCNPVHQQLASKTK